jgi:hypothetical protein
MANWCRSIVTVLGSEPEVARFVDYLGPDENEDEGVPLTLIADCYLRQRTPGRAEYELLSKWSPPLDPLTEVSRQFPSLTLQVEWEQPGDDMLGCAVISDGHRNVLTLDHLLEYAKERFREVYQERFRDEWEDDEGEADVAMSWEILREATRRFFAEQQDEQKEEADGLWAVARGFARQVVEESDTLLSFTGGGVVTEGLDEWQERSARFPGDRDLIVPGEEPVPNGEVEELLNELLGDMMPDAQNHEQVKWQRQGF